MQAVSKKYKGVTAHQDVKASDRFTARVEIARSASHNVTDLSNRLCKELVSNILNEALGNRKK